MTTFAIESFRVPSSIKVNLLFQHNKNMEQQK